MPAGFVQVEPFRSATRLCATSNKWSHAGRIEKRLKYMSSCHPFSAAAPTNHSISAKSPRTVLASSPSNCNASSKALPAETERSSPFSFFSFSAMPSARTSRVASNPTSKPGAPASCASIKTNRTTPRSWGSITTKRLKYVVDILTKTPELLIIAVCAQLDHLCEIRPPSRYIVPVMHAFQHSGNERVTYDVATPQRMGRYCRHSSYDVTQEPATLSAFASARSGRL